MFNKECELCQVQPGVIMLQFSEEDQIRLCQNCKTVFETEAKKIEEALLKGSHQSPQEALDELRKRIDERRQTASGQPKVKPSLVEELTVNLNQDAQDGRIDTVIGRSSEIQRAAEILSRRTKNNPVFVGEAGVGKTAIAEGLALAIVSGEAPDCLADKEIRRLDVSAILQGTGFRGQLEAKMEALIKEMKDRPNTILFIDELHLLVGAGVGSRDNKGMDISNMLKPALARGEFQMMGATTRDEYRVIEGDSALARRFQPIVVDEPSIESNHAIMFGLREVYETFHGVSYTDEAIRAATELSKRYIADRFLPDKSIDLLDEAGAKLKQQSDESERVVDVELIACLIEEKTGIPVQKLTQEDSENLLEMEATLQSKVIGQDKAATLVAETIRRNRLGFGNHQRPIGTFMFVGPTGVGKTEMAKALAEELYGSRENFTRLDMSEYMEKHSVSRLIGSPPGYVGHDEAGQLTEAVRRKPYSLLLVDELEKAHPDVLNLFLQIMEDGRLTDSKGREISFKDTLIIMTSNASVDIVEEKTVGFGAPVTTEAEQSVRERLKGAFRPEFLNRFDGIVEFSSLTKTQLRDIAQLMLVNTYATMESHGVRLTIEDRVIDQLVELGYSPDMGARPLRRVIEQSVENLVASFYMRNTKMKDVHLSMMNGEIVATEQMTFEFEEYA